MRCTADGGVCGNLFGREHKRAFFLIKSLCLGFEAVLKFQQCIFVTGLAQLVDFLHMLACQLVEQLINAVVVFLSGHIQQLCFAEFPSGHDVELASRRGAFGVHVVAHTGSCQGTLLVEELRHELGRHGVTHIAASQHCRVGSCLAVRVACLNHKLADDAVEEGRVIHAFLGELDEVVAVLRGFVIQFHHDVS